ncbi:unnamed protein product [Amoebophrya sp. A25]|nr:unnamed protein product [Amoebophrya sp. A25]|eukprot:GSA25T00011974001.1
MGRGTKSDFFKVVHPCEKQVTINSEGLSRHGIHRVGIDGNALIHRAIPKKLKEEYVKATRESPNAAKAQQVSRAIAARFRQVVERIAPKTLDTVVTVFDGEALPEKSECHRHREEARNKAFDERRFDQAFHCDKAIVEECNKALNEVTPNSSIIAAYEADHQLAYLYNRRRIDAVLADDTDFLWWQIPLLRKVQGLKNPDNKDDISATLIDLKKDYEKCPDLFKFFLPTMDADVYQGEITFWKYSSAESRQNGGFGFIKCTETHKQLPPEARGKTLFFHASNVKQGGFKNCRKGAAVEFVLERTNRVLRSKRDSPFVGVRVTGIGGKDVPKYEAEGNRPGVREIFPYQREVALAVLLTGNDYNGAHIPGCGLAIVKKHLKDAMFDEVRFANRVGKDKNIPRGFVKSIKRASWLVKHGPVKDECGNIVPLSGDPNVQMRDPLFAGTLNKTNPVATEEVASTMLPSNSTAAGEVEPRTRSKGRSKKGKGKRKGKGKQ